MVRWNCTKWMTEVSVHRKPFPYGEGFFVAYRNKMKDFKTIDEQIKILDDRGLVFLNVETAKLNLIRYGYYEIVNGYKDPMLLEPGSEYFKEGTTFEHIFELYKLDKELKNYVLQSTLDFELNIKTVFSYVISKNYGVINNSYLNKKNYNLGEKNKKGQYPLNYLFNKFNRIINYDLEPYKHYREDHGHTPPWILFKGCDFGNIKYFYNLQKGPIKSQIISLMTDFPVEMVENFDKLKYFFSDTLDLCYTFRNRAAHSGRIYNYRPQNAKIRYYDVIHNIQYISIDEADYRKGYGKNDLYTLLKSLTVIENLNPATILSTGITYSVDNYLKKYPEDRIYLLTELGVPINKLENDINKIF